MSFISRRLAGVNYESLVDGEGVRAAIYLSGCPHHCPNCHNPETWNHKNGEKITDKLIDAIANEIDKRPFISGITFTGGDPMYMADDTWLFLMKLGNRLGDLETDDFNIWIYTGYTWEELIEGRGFSLPEKFAIEALLNCTTVLVDGPFKQELADKRLLFRGSSNQRLIDVPQSLMEGKVVLWNASN